MPFETPETFPEASIEATEISLLLHDPPGVAFESAITDPTHTFEYPVIADGDGLIVIVVVLPEDNVAMQPPVCSDVIVIVVDPAFASVAVVKVPEAPLITSVAVSPVAALGVERS